VSEQEIKVDIELLKKDVVTMSALLEKFDTTIDKMQEIASSLSRMVSLQEQRLENQEKTTAEMQSVLEMRRIETNNNIKDIYNRINTVNKELTDKIEDSEKSILAELQKLRQEIQKEDTGISKRLGQIEIWKYGAAAVITFLLFLIANNAININKLFD
jgi:predicted RNase H-like nuclease (RuvC/YqgF family)